MKNIIIGTAGHIDHGKTTLIKALTGRNTDRWAEEQRRGITIDLGFTYFDLPGGNRVGIIDVPGHERFVNNMVTGVVGMDLVMLVVAADEGIMPQTREHIDILEQLGIEKSIIVLNKCDLVDDEWKELVNEDIKDELKGTFFEKAPIAEVSAATGQGMEELIQLIDTMTNEEISERDTSTIPRLPIDRAFSLSGFGTIVTGTLISGTIKKDDQLQVYPAGKICKIRNIQVHGENKDCCYAGQRVAINLANIKKSEINRGCVLAPIDSMGNTMMLDVKLNVLKSSPRVIENRTRLHLFTGTSEVLCRAVILDKEEIGPGEGAYVQLRLEEEIAVRRGDKFIVRFYSPMETVGGGVILEANPSKKKRFDESAVSELEAKEGGGHIDIIEMLIKQHSETMISVAEAAKLTALSKEEIAELTAILERDGKISVFAMKKDTYLWHKDYEREKEEEIIRFITDFYKKNPYKYGISKSEIRMKFLSKVKQNVFDLVIQLMIDKKLVKQYNEYISSYEFEMIQDSLYQESANKIKKALKEAGYDFIKFMDIDFGSSQSVAEDILQLLVDGGEVIKVTPEIYTLHDIMEAAKDIVVGKLQENKIVTIAELRDSLNTSRKSVKSLIEYLDSIKVTKRNGPESERVPYL